MRRWRRGQEKAALALGMEVQQAATWRKGIAAEKSEKLYRTRDGILKLCDLEPERKRQKR